MWAGYLYLTLSAPYDSSNQLHLTKEVTNLIRLSIAVPYLLIWLAAAYSFVKIKRYAIAIKPSIESSAFNKIANGVLILLGSLILASYSNSLKNLLVDNATLRPILTIITNYAYVFPYLFGFILLFKSAKELLNQHMNVKIPFSNYIVLGIPLVVFVYVWLELIFTNETRVIAVTEASKFATYYLPDSILILTIVIPSLITWVLGVLTVIKFRLYYHRVKGILYKIALSTMIQGLVGVILGSVFLQSLLSLGSKRLIELGLDSLLLVIYFFLFLQAVGFYLIARGANKLTKIENV